MTKRGLFPSELPLEATTLSPTADWVAVQLDGETQLRKAHPSVINVPEVLDSDLVTISNLSHYNGNLIFSNGSNWISSNTIEFGWRLLSPGNTGSNPTYASQSDPDTGICFYSANTVGFTTYGVARCGVGSTGNFVPLATNTYSCGSSSNRWTEAWVTGGICAVSDLNEKKDIENSDLGLDFILALRPVKYRWINRANTATPIVDADGLTVSTVITPSPGVRYHYGLVAQEVAAVLDGQDFAGYLDDAETGVKGLRYSEFIAPLIAAIQALHERVAQLEADRA